MNEKLLKAIRKRSRVTKIKERSYLRYAPKKITDVIEFEMEEK